MVFQTINALQLKTPAVEKWKKRQSLAVGTAGPSTTIAGSAPIATTASVVGADIAYGGSSSIASELLAQIPFKEMLS